MRRSKTSAAVVLSLLLLLLFPTSQAQEVVEQGKLLRPVADSYVRSEGPDNNWGLGWSLSVGEGNREETLTYLMFDLSEVPSDAHVTGASLQLFTASVPTNTTTIIGVHYCPSNDWTENGITYNNKPAFSQDPVDSVNVTQAQRMYEWNVADTVSTTLQSGNKKLTLVLKAETRGSMGFYSSEQPADPLNDIHPRLRVTYLAPRQSNADPAPAVLAIIIIAGAATITLTVAYTRLKKRRQPGQKPSQPEA